MKPQVLYRSLTIGLLGSTMLSGIAQAEEVTSAAGAHGEEIIVTAQRREESLQRVPVSMQALTPEILENHQVQGLDDYVTLLPSVTLQSYGPSATQLFFRGVTTGTDGHPYGALPTSALYLDDAPVTTIGSTVDLHVYDVERVEALAGPQGTLYGASSLSGVVRIITNKPDPSGFAGGFDLETNKYGTGGYGGSSEGYVNIPISPSVALRAVIYYRHEGGYLDNVLKTRTLNRPYTGPGDVPMTAPVTLDNSRLVQDDFNTSDTVGGRLALGVHLDDNWTVTPSIIYQKHDFKGSFLWDPKAGDLNVSDFIDGASSDEWYQAALTIEGRIGDWDVLYSGSHMDRKLNAVYDYSYYTVSIDAYSDYNYFVDAHGQVIDPSMFLNDFHHFKKDTHELRVNSPGGERIEVTLGAFYQRQQNANRVDFYIPGLGDALDAFGQKRAVLDDAFYLNQAVRVDRDYALFGQARLEITDGLALTGGIRFYEYNNTIKGFSGNRWTVDSLCGGTYSSSCISLDKAAKGSGQTYRVNLSWQLDADRMIYATYSTGFRPGGINRPVGVRPYESDSLINYEAGWKTSWFDGMFRFNGAVYHQVWKDLHYGVPVGTVISFANAGDAKINGVEVDAQIRTGGLTLSAAGAYNDAKLSTDFCYLTSTFAQNCDPAAGGGLLAEAGTRLPIQPKFKGTLTARYEFALNDNIDAFFQLSSLHQSNSTSRIEEGLNSQLGNLPGFTTLDFSFGGSSGGTLIEFFINNLTDERGELSRQPNCSWGQCLTNARSAIVKPRFMGIRVSHDF